MPTLGRGIKVPAFKPRSQAAGQPKGDSLEQFGCLMCPHGHSSLAHTPTEEVRGPSLIFAGKSHHANLRPCPGDAGSLCGYSAGPASNPALPPTARVPQPEKENTYLFLLPFGQMCEHKVPSKWRHRAAVLRPRCCFLSPAGGSVTRKALEMPMN